MKQLYLVTLVFRGLYVGGTSVGFPRIDLAARTHYLRKVEERDGRTRLPLLGLLLEPKKSQVRVCMGSSVREG